MVDAISVRDIVAGNYSPYAPISPLPLVSTALIRDISSLRVGSLPSSFIRSSSSSWSIAPLPSVSTMSKRRLNRLPSMLALKASCRIRVGSEAAAAAAAAAAGGWRHSEGGGAAKGQTQSYVL